MVLNSNQFNSQQMKITGRKSQKQLSGVRNSVMRYYTARLFYFTGEKEEEDKRREREGERDKRFEEHTTKL